MVNNYDRIFSEITKEAEHVASGNIDSEILVNLTMEIVDLEDRHRIKPTRINQLVEDRIIASARQFYSEES